MTQRVCHELGFGLIIRRVLIKHIIVNVGDKLINLVNVRKKSLLVGCPPHQTLSLANPQTTN